MDVNEIFKIAKRQMLQEGQHHPMVFIEVGKQLYASILTDFPDTNSEKQAAFFKVGYNTAMENDIEATDVQEIAFVSEAWYASVEEGEQYTRPSERPDRKEMLMITTLSLQDKPVQHMQMSEIIRHGGIVDLVPFPSPQGLDVRSNLLTACLGGIISAALTENERVDVLKRYIIDQQDVLQEESENGS